MKTVRMKIDVLNPTGSRIDPQRVDATTEAEIARHKAADDADVMLDAAKFARRVRRCLGFSQAEFADRIDVSLDTIRNWEQGKRSPTQPNPCCKGTFENSRQGSGGCAGCFALSLWNSLQRLVVSVEQIGLIQIGQFEWLS